MRVVVVVLGTRRHSEAEKGAREGAGMTTRWMGRLGRRGMARLGGFGGVCVRSWARPCRWRSPWASWTRPCLGNVVHRVIREMHRKVPGSEGGLVDMVQVRGEGWMHMVMVEVARRSRHGQVRVMVTKVQCCRGLHRVQGEC